MEQRSDLSLLSVSDASRTLAQVGVAAVPCDLGALEPKGLATGPKA